MEGEGRNQKKGRCRVKKTEELKSSRKKEGGSGK